MAGSPVGRRPARRRVARIQVLLAQIGTQLLVAWRLVVAVFRVFYDFFAVACVTATAVVIIDGKPREAFVWGGSGIALALGWVAARLAKRAVARVRRVLRDEWSQAPAEADRNSGDRHTPR
jgi:uncharacterized membrane protein